MFYFYENDYRKLFRAIFIRNRCPIFQFFDSTEL